MSARTDGVPWEIDPLRLRFRTGSRPPLGRLLRSVPRPLALSPAWIPAVDVVARRVLPGVRSRGSAGGGRQGFYAALDLHRITAATVAWDGVDQGPPPETLTIGAAGSGCARGRVADARLPAHDHRPMITGSEPGAGQGLLRVPVR